MKYPAYVYMLAFNNGKYYVGLSANPAARFACHKSLLQLGRHPVEDMQADYNASPDRYLDYCILDTVETKSERHKEHRWQLALRTYERDFGYNYKDPTKRREQEKADNRERCMAFLKRRMNKVLSAATHTHERSQT